MQFRLRMNIHMSHDCFSYFLSSKIVSVVSVVGYVKQGSTFQINMPKLSTSSNNNNNISEDYKVPKT